MKTKPTKPTKTDYQKLIIKYEKMFQAIKRLRAILDLS